MRVSAGAVDASPFRTEAVLVPSEAIMIVLVETSRGRNLPAGPRLNNLLHLLRVIGASRPALSVAAV